MSKSRPSVGPIRKHDGSFTTTDKECAEAMATFFASVYHQEPLPIADTPSITTTNLTMVIFTLQKVSWAVKRMKKYAAPGPDGIPPVILKECGALLYPILSTFFNACLTQNYIPDEWKSANVIPLHKHGSIHEPGNFRPISLTSVVGKVMESIVSYDLVHFGLSNGLIKPTQFGFLPGRSCESQLLVYTDRIINCLNTGDWVDSVYLDFKKAFDQVPHSRLINILKAHGVREHLLG